MRLYNAHSCTPVGSKSTLKSTTKASPTRYLPTENNATTKGQANTLKGIYDVTRNVEINPNSTLGEHYGFHQSRLIGQGQIGKPIIPNYKLGKNHTTPEDTSIKANSTDETDVTSPESSADEVSVPENSITTTAKSTLQRLVQPAPKSQVGPWNFTISSSFSSDSEWSDWQNRARALGEIQGEQPSTWSDSGIGSDGFPLHYLSSSSHSSASVGDINNWPKPHKFYSAKMDSLIPESSLLDALPSSFSSSLASDDEQAQSDIGKEYSNDSIMKRKRIEGSEVCLNPVQTQARASNCSDNDILRKHTANNENGDHLKVETQSKKPSDLVNLSDSRMASNNSKHSDEPELDPNQSQDCARVHPEAKPGASRNEDIVKHQLADCDGMVEIKREQSLELSTYADGKFTTENEDVSSDDEQFSSVRSNLNKLSNNHHLDNLKKVLISRQATTKENVQGNEENYCRNKMSGAVSQRKESSTVPSPSISVGREEERRDVERPPPSTNRNEVCPEITEYFIKLVAEDDARAPSDSQLPVSTEPSVSDVLGEMANSGANGASSMESGLTTVTLEDDPMYAKYFKMLAVGLPMGAAKNAMERDGLDPNIMDGDLGKPVSRNETKVAAFSLKNDPTYAKYFKMLSVGLPMGAVKNAMERDGLDPNIMDGDHDKPVSKEENEVASTDLKNDPTYSKYFKMLSVGLPTGAVKNAMERDGIDEVAINSVLGVTLRVVKDPPAPKDQYRRTRVHWNTHCNVERDTMWSMIDQDSDVSKVLIDEKEFLNLFQAKLKASKASSSPVCQTGDFENKLLIDRKRANNGGIVLARVKLTYAEIAAAIETFNEKVFTQEQISGLMDYVPTEEEQKLLKDYLDQPKSNMETLCECEKFMVNMLDISDVQSKLHALSFIKKFATNIESLCRDATLVRTACEQIVTSGRLRKVLGIILNIGNKLNTAGPGNKKKAEAITLDSLLKLDQVKALDKTTTFLRFVASVINRNKPSLANFKEDLRSVFEAQRIDLGSSLSELQRLSNELEDVRQIALRHDLRDVHKCGANDHIVENHRAGDLPSTSVGRFLTDASQKISSAMRAFETTQKRFTELLQYFGEDSGEKMESHEVFQIVVTFSNSFDSALEQAITAEKLKSQSKKKMRFSQLKCKTSSNSDESDKNKQAGANVGAMLKELKSRTKLRLRRGRC